MIHTCILYIYRVRSAQLKKKKKEDKHLLLLLPLLLTVIKIRNVYGK